ncbi:MAG: gliding motility-associated C-terminal domain-containing protein [Bacteroidetes bacterium]|nr:gliding motility-associated C-terminal domain-containing protein [Bacteroidota bacterium]
MNKQLLLKSLFFGILISLFQTRISAQNLVLNPSFENTSSNCGNLGGEGFTTDLLNWDDANSGADSCSSPDLFSACNTLPIVGGPGPTNMPNSALGYQYSRTGTHHAGIITYDGTDQYREYIEGQTSAPLVAGQVYCVSMYVSLANSVVWSTNNIGIYFSPTNYQRNACPGTTNSRINVTPQLNYTCSPIMDTMHWVRLQWSYTATGGEKYFVIGNFYDNSNTTVVTNPGGTFTNPYAYFYIDDVSIVPNTCCYADIMPVAALCSNASAITMTATAGLGNSCTSAITGTWSGVGITNTSTGVFNPSTAGAGVHTVSFSISCGYTATMNVTVNPCNITVCKTGSVITASGGTAPYTWATSTQSVDCSGCPFGICNPFSCPGNTVTVWTTAATNTSTFNATSFPIRVSDNAGSTYTITSLAALTTCTTTFCPTLTLSVSSQTNVNCFGTSTGSATVNTSGGAAAYSYTWSPGNLNGASQTGLAAGIYTIAIKDANSCPGTGTVSITQPSIALSASITATSAASCGSSNGNATVFASGGTAGYTYNWAPSGGTAATSASVAAGSYTVTVTDAKGCTKTAMATINSAGGPTLSVVSQASVNCYGANSGSATVSASGGTGPYTYTWNPGNLNGSSQSSLSAGVYTIQVADAGSCISSGTLSIMQPSAALSATLSSSPATCGQSNGSASIVISGGTPSYTFSWSPVSGSGTSMSSLPAGSYSVLVTDSKGCNTTANTIVTSTSGPTVTVVSTNNVNCYGAATGSASVISTGGATPFTYTWSPGNLSGSTQYALAAGVYTISSSNANGCIGSTTLSITQPTAALNASISATLATSCGSSVGGATVSASGGTPGYTYNWSPAGGSAAGTSGLAAGNYTVTVTDSKNCTQSAVATISSAGGPTISVVSQTSVTCFGGNDGNATISASGGAGSYTYSWSPSGGSTASANNLTAGIYTVTVKDAANCANTATIQILQTAKIVATVTTTPSDCGTNNGTATLSSIVGGHGASSYLWSTGEMTNSISNLSPGSYSLIVWDNKGCRDTVYFSVGQNNGGLSANAGPSATIKSGESVTLNGTVPSGTTYTWSPATGLSCTNCEDPVASPTVTTVYVLTVSNSSGCTAFDTVTVYVELPCGELFIPTAFSPNDDGQNDVLFVMGNCITDLEFAVFDRWGEKVFETTDPAIGWDGTYAGKKMDPAVFAYFLRATVDGTSVKKHGSVTIVK